MRRPEAQQGIGSTKRLGIESVACIVLTHHQDKDKDGAQKVHEQNHKP